MHQLKTKKQALLLNILYEPPLDAYMDDMPPLQDESGHYELDTPESERIVEPSPSAEEQLTSTADMLALRQKLNKKKTQDADAKSSSAANAKNAKR